MNGSPHIVSSTPVGTFPIEIDPNLVQKLDDSLKMKIKFIDKAIKDGSTLKAELKVWKLHESDYHRGKGIPVNKFGHKDNKKLRGIVDKPKKDEEINMDKKHPKTFDEFIEYLRSINNIQDLQHIIDLIKKNYIG